MESKYFDSIIADLCELVKIPSRSSLSGGEEGAIQAVMARKMKEAGARVRTFEPDDVPGFRNHSLCYGPDRCYKNRPMVIGEMGPADAPALLIMAHSDTVPVFDPQKWSQDPFCGEIRDGAILGLGVSDDKWGLAVMLGLMRELRDNGRPLTKRLIFVSTIDEEHGVGNGMLLLTLAGVKATGGLYLDGYLMQILIGNLGGSHLYLRPVHKDQIQDMSRHYERLKAQCAELSERRSALFGRLYFQDNVMRSCSVQVVRRQDETGDYLLVLFYTLPGEDGTQFCRDLEVRIREGLEKQAEDYNWNYDKVWFQPALIPADTPLIGCLADAVRMVCGHAPVITTMCKQDVFVMNNVAGIPTVSFGCTRRVSGNGAYHSPDEYLRIDELQQGWQIVRQALNRWLSS